MHACLHAARTNEALPRSHGPDVCKPAGKPERECQRTTKNRDLRRTIYEPFMFSFDFHFDLRIVLHGNVILTSFDCQSANRIASRTTRLMCHKSAMPPGTRPNTRSGRVRDRDSRQPTYPRHGSAASSTRAHGLRLPRVWYMIACSRLACQLTRSRRYSHSQYDGTPPQLVIPSAGTRSGLHLPPIRRVRSLQNPHVIACTEGHCLIAHLSLHVSVASSLSRSPRRLFPIAPGLTAERAYGHG